MTLQRAWRLWQEAIGLECRCTTRLNRAAVAGYTPAEIDHLTAVLLRAIRRTGRREAAYLRLRAAARGVDRRRLLDLFAAHAGRRAVREAASRREARQRLRERGPA